MERGSQRGFAVRKPWESTNRSLPVTWMPRSVWLLVRSSRSSLGRADVKLLWLMSRWVSVELWRSTRAMADPNSASCLGPKRLWERSRTCASNNGNREYHVRQHNQGWRGKSWFWPQEQQQWLGGVSIPEDACALQVPSTAGERREPGRHAKTSAGIRSRRWLQFIHGRHGTDTQLPAPAFRSTPGPGG
mgnify:CR=1 FL=1